MVCSFLFFSNKSSFAMLSVAYMWLLLQYWYFTNRIIYYQMIMFASTTLFTQLYVMFCVLLTCG